MNDKINELFCKIDAQDRLINYQVLEISNLKKEKEELENKINKANKKINNMFDRGDETTLIDDLLELLEILGGK